MADELNAKFASLGIEDAKAKEIMKNKKVATALGEIIEESGASGEQQKAVVALLQSLATKTKDCKDEAAKANRKLVSRAILEGRLKTNVQVDAAWKYVETAGNESNDADLDKESGVGVVITDEQVAAAVDSYIEANKADIEERRYKVVPSVITGVKALPEMKFANPASFKPIIDEKILKLLGPKDERDLVKKKEKAPKKDEGKKGGDSATTNTRSMFSEGFLGNLHKPGGNPQKYEERMKEHLEFTGGKVFTRFPPEPNGYLHIGHSKAITVNFGYAQYYNGKCYLRYDDTNPEAEEEVYFRSIREIIEWLGFEPYKITHSSDYFDQLYELAEKLISKGLAYVCFCTPEEVKEQRGASADGKSKGGERFACSHREMAVDKALEEFRAMRDGKYKPGEATLRMKQDLSNPNPQMWDLVAYRVLNASHHRTGDKWKIYPTYDFTHCLVDSIENISHSLCTLEFYLSRESYEWLCDAVEVYRPAQREYGRLNITGTILSKRKILKLVNEGIVRGWDDPRLFTLVAIKRRGVPPGAILSFVSQLGVTTSTTNIQVSRFENSIRKYLEDHTPRLMMVPDPVPVILDNLPDDHFEEISVPFKPGSPEMGEHKVPFTKKVYVDRSDFREEATDDYFRLAPGKSVGLLKVPCNIRVTSFKKDESTGKVTEIHAHYENDIPFKKPKTFIQWVADAPSHGSPVKIDEVRLFNQLFKSENPSAHPDGFLADVNPESETVLKGALIEKGFHEVKQKSPWVAPKSAEEEKDGLRGKEKPGAPEAVRFQALRVGYFCMDSDSSDDKLVLNRIVTLKEDSGK